MYDFTVHGEANPAVIRIGLPPSSLLKFPPSELPATVPAPVISEPTWNQPFNIPPTLYNQLLDVRVPITIASVYAVTVVLVNRINKSRGYKPYGFSQTRLFKLFVILHNVFLAIYSAWTFAGMIRAFRSSWPSRDDPNYVAAVADTLCKINGPRGYGNAATYDSTVDQWTFRNPEFSLAAGGVPDPSDLGRLWNEGLAFLGWIFYLSKFYEVLDTVIILAKGKKSSTLQTYHHAGAMMCMWAGIRYVAAPIWIFTLVNSGIHALMYTYYTVTALHIRVPTVIKRSLTTMQITQFIIGSTMAASYLFFSYTLPVGQTAPASPVDTPTVPAGTAGAGLVPWLKKLGFRAAGAEGIAENVGVPEAAAGARVLHVGPMVTCMDTSGQGFAIWLNVMYLLPLTYLFARFFVRSYLYRKEPGPRQPTQLHAAEKAGMDALRGVSREIRKAVEVNGETSEATEDEAVNKIQALRAQKNQQKPAENSPIRTRATAAKQKTRVASSDADSDSGFSTVSGKKGAKKATKEELQSSTIVVDTKDSNPYEVLDRSA
ncbi:fatty acid elongase [Aspergillus eucalypticola CBS 122712]|uniref:Elongation of fatty acids protein n=1 Tax=Aspergillus eucalypticola (strain CBS 122712 / IBT 29274) TaxID=1448314 RepID=A0A317VQQ7_ASPEC|nr:fatty acid elongase [Aspergillus eucalypticola CBS 122712]PWY76643.1 fatty acid elongase [Aspergillus eucalypticola CBS 122712]